MIRILGLIVNSLQAEGFSNAIIDRFFRPFLGGIFFDNDLQVTSRLFEFVMRMLAEGQNSLPSQGIGAVADQLAAALPAGSIQTGLPPMLAQPCAISASNQEAHTTPACDSSCQHCRAMHQSRG